MSAAALRAVSEPRRQQILRLVWDQERPAGEIAASFDVTFGAPPGEVFRVFPRPGPLRPLDGRGRRARPEPGGRLRVGYPNGQVAGGRVVAVEPDRRIVFTWGCEGDGQAVPAGSSTVEITLEPVAGGTEVRLRHSGLPAGEPPL